VRRACIRSSQRAARRHRPHFLDALAAYDNDPVAEVDRRIAMARDQPEPIADAGRRRVIRDVDDPVLVRGLAIRQRNPARSMAFLDRAARRCPAASSEQPMRDLPNHSASSFRVSDFFTGDMIERRISGKF